LLVPAFGQSGAQSGSGASQSGAQTGSGAGQSGSGYAGSASGAGQTVAGTDMNSPSRTDQNNHDFNFGWLGLVGLAGLLGMRRPHRHTMDTDTRNINNTGPSGVR